MEHSINIKNSYLLIIIVIGLVALSTYSTFALFSDSIETNEIVSISAINLNINVDDVNVYNEIDLNSYEKKSVLIRLNNYTDYINFYKIWYKLKNDMNLDNGVKVYKNISSSNNTNGNINANGKLEIELTIVNYTNKKVSISLGVDTSRDNNVVLTDGKLEILDIENNIENKSISTDGGELEVDKCTKFTTIDNTSGVYKIELGSNNSYISGFLFLDNTKELYMCLGSEKGNFSYVSIKEPNKDWYYDLDYANKLMLVTDEENKSFVLDRKNYTKLINLNDKYNNPNIKNYFMSNISYSNNDKSVYKKGFARISLVLPYEKLTKSLTINKIFIDGSLSNYPSQGSYYLKNYECSNVNANLVWDNNNYTIKSTNTLEGDTCNIYLSTSTKMLSGMRQGEYVKYEPTGGTVLGKNLVCSTTDCKEDISSCYNKNYNELSFRIAYVLKEGNELVPYLVSSDVVSCLGDKNIDNLNNYSIKYCNDKFVYGGNCNKDTGSVNTWIFNAKDYERILSNGYSAEKCLNLNYIDNKCGYNNNLINIKGGYAVVNGDSLLSYSNKNNGLIDGNNNDYGIRVVVKLNPNTKVLSGNGTYEDPYSISID